MSYELIGIFGGTFDPIHNGHIDSLISLTDEFDFQSIYLLPSGIPPHRAPTASTAQDRLNMVKLAITGHPRLVADSRESICAGKSYTINTLKSFRAQFNDLSLAFIAGMDAYLDMPNWKNWQEFLEYAHIIVMNRPGHHAIDNAWGKPYLVRDKSEITDSLSGKIYYADSLLVDISSTEIKEKLKKYQNVERELPRAVINYIQTRQLYAHT